MFHTLYQVCLNSIRDEHLQNKYLRKLNKSPYIYPEYIPRNLTILHLPVQVHALIVRKH